MSLLNFVKRPMVLMLCAAVLVIGALAAAKFVMIMSAMSGQASMGPPPTAVTSLVVQESEWQDSINVVGSLEATQGVNVSSEEDGKVVKIGFESGATVKPGDLLVQLDTSIEEAQLKSAEAEANLAQINLARALRLRGNNANSEADLNNAVSKAKAAGGQAEMYKAMIARKNIIAPFAGRAGIRMVQLGQYVTKGQPIVPVYASDPIYLNFSVPQQQLGRIAIGQRVQAAIDAFPDKSFEGRVSSIDPQVQGDTRHVRVQATLPNPGEVLRSGMFANVSVVTTSSVKVIAVPGSSVNYAPYGNSVYVISKKQPAEGEAPAGDGKTPLVVRQQIVKLGSSRGDQVAILEGLKTGEEIVTAGVSKLRPGADVIVNNTVTPGNDPNPVPADT